MPLTNMKPAFYRVGTHAVQSGWINKATGDYCNTEEDNENAIRVIPGARSAFTIGHRFQFARAVDLYPDAMVESGECCVVASVNDDSGEVCFKLEGFHMGLHDNMLSLAPFHDDDVIACLEAYKQPVAAKRRREVVPSLWWTVPVIAALTPLAWAMTLYFQPHTASIFFGAAIVLTAVIMGAGHALILALAFPIIRNLIIVPPSFELNAPTPDEYVRAAVWVAMALATPWLIHNARSIRKMLVRLEGGKEAPEASKVGEV